VFGHAVADLAQISTNMGEAGLGAQQVGGQGVPSLMRHVVAEVQVGNPFAEPAVEPLIGERDGAVMFAVGGRKQRQPGAFRAGGPVTMLGGEVTRVLRCRSLILIRTAPSSGVPAALRRSPHTLRNAESKTGSWTSTCPRFRRPSPPRPSRQRRGQSTSCPAMHPTPPR
jgi:hypothetical protein